MPEVPHIGFIVAAYVVAALVATLLIAWIVVDHRAQRRVLAELEARGGAKHTPAKDAA